MKKKRRLLPRNQETLTTNTPELTIEEAWPNDPSQKEKAVIKGYKEM